jgi:hypothetical protein
MSRIPNTALRFLFVCIPVLSKEGRVARKDDVQVYEFVDCIPHILLQGGQVAFVLENPYVNKTNLPHPSAPHLILSYSTGITYQQGCGSASL